MEKVFHANKVRVLRLVVLILVIVEFMMVWDRMNECNCCIRVE